MAIIIGKTNLLNNSRKNNNNRILNKIEKITTNQQENKYKSCIVSSRSYFKAFLMFDLSEILV